MKRWTVVALLIFVGLAVHSAETYSVSMDIGPPGQPDEEYRQELADEIAYEFSLHDEINWLFEPFRGIDEGWLELDAPIFTLSIDIIDLGEGLIAFCVLSIQIDIDKGYYGIPSDKWFYGSVDSIGSQIARKIVQWVTRESAPFWIDHYYGE